MPEDDLAKVVERQVNRLDRSALDAIYSGRGEEAFDPICLLRMVLYQYLNGEQSPARWVSEARYHDAMKWLGRGYQPSRSSWYNFRDRSRKFIDTLHAQIVNQTINDGQLDPSTGSVDGSTIGACASKNRMINNTTLQKRMAILKAITLGTYAGEVPKWVPPTASGRQDLSNRFVEAEVELKKRLEANEKRASDKRKSPDKILVSTSEPEAILGLDKKKYFRALYNAQMVVAPGSWLIMSFTCEASASDVGMLRGMIDRTQEIVGGRLKTILADASYISITDLRKCSEREVELIGPFQANLFTEGKKSKKARKQIPKDQFTFDAENNVYICPAGQRLGLRERIKVRRQNDEYLMESRYQSKEEVCRACLLAKDCLTGKGRRRNIKRLDGQELLDAHRQKMALPEYQELYKLRCQTVELAHADCKGNRRMTRFHGRGQKRTRTELGLMVIATNLMRIDRMPRTALKPCENTS